MKKMIDYLYKEVNIRRNQGDLINNRVRIFIKEGIYMKK